MSHQQFLDDIPTKMDGVYKQLDKYKADFVSAYNTTPHSVAAAFPSFSGRPANLEEQWKRLQGLYAVVDDLKQGGATFFVDRPYKELRNQAGPHQKFSFSIYTTT